jgi:carboxyl-terminal processing protease
VWVDEESDEELDAELALLSTESEEDEEANEEEDPLLQESGRVLVDMAELLGNPMSAAEVEAPVQSASVAVTLPNQNEEEN